MSVTFCQPWHWLGDDLDAAVGADRPGSVSADAQSIPQRDTGSIEPGRRDVSAGLVSPAVDEVRRRAAEIRARNAARATRSIGPGPAGVPLGRDSDPHASSPPPTGSRLADDLIRLASLHASGALTDTEFQAAKARLLAT